MSIIIEDTVPAPPIRSANRHPTSAEKNLTKILNPKQKVLRLDSPTTIEACHELGVIVEDLKQKTFEQFKDPMLEEDLAQVRYNHYLKRYKQSVKDVFARKKEIVRANARRHRQNQQSQQQQQYDSGRNSNKSLNHLSDNRMLPDSIVPNTTKHFHNTSGNSLLPPGIINNFNKTMMYLRTSHDTAATVDCHEIIINEGNSFNSNDSVEQFAGALGVEISKFNKIKRQKQKEAMDVFDAEMKRLQLSEDLKLREQRNQAREKKLEAEKLHTIQEKKKRAEEKLEKIRDLDRRFNENKIEERQKMNKKNKEAEKKAAEENEEKRKHMDEQEQKFQQKKKKAEELRDMLKKQEYEKTIQLKAEIDEKLWHSTEVHNMTINEKTSRVKSQISRIEENAKKIREKQEAEEHENVQRLIEKMVKKEESYKTFQLHQKKEIKQREMDIASKSKRFLAHKEDLNGKYEHRMQEINERFKRVQENLEAKREQEEKEMRIRQELTNLRIMDKQDNYNRKLRQTQYERQKILDRQKHNEEKLVMLKNQKEILQKAKIEVSIQSKIEKDRISEGVQLLSKLTAQAQSGKELTDQQKKILREIVRPEDYKNLEELEKKRQKEKLLAEEQKKADAQMRKP